MPPENYYFQINLKDYWRVIKKKRWAILVPIIIIPLTTLIITLKAPPRYQSTATLLIEPENPYLKLSGLRDGTSSPLNLKVFYNTQYALFESRSLAQDVLDQLPPENKTFFQSNKNSSSGFLKKLPNSTAATNKPTDPVDKFIKQIKITPVMESNLVKVSCQGRSGPEAAKITNTLIQVYVKKNYGWRQDDFFNTIQTLATNLPKLQKNYEASLEKLYDFKQSNEIMPFKEYRNITMARLSQLTEKLTESESERILLESQYQNFQNHPHALMTKNHSKATSLEKFIQKLYLQKSSLEMEHRELITKYKKKHPVWQKKNAEKSAIEYQIQVARNQLLNNLQITYKQIEAEEAALKKIIAKERQKTINQEQQYAQLESLIKDCELKEKVFNKYLGNISALKQIVGLKNTNIKVIDYAKVPQSPINHRVVFNFLLSLFISLLVGFAFAFITEYFDDSIDNEEILSFYAKDLPLLGTLPLIDFGKVTSDSSDPSTNLILVQKEPYSNYGESIRMIRTGSNCITDKSKTIYLTSASPNEGKTLTALNFAATLAQDGKKVLLVEADLRKPSLQNHLGLKDHRGIAEVLLKKNKLEEVIQQSGLANLNVLLAGKISTHPVSLLESPAMNFLVETTKKSYDNIIFDLPPALLVADAALLASKLDLGILIVYAGRTRGRLIQKSIQQLRQSGAKAIGIVLNAVPHQHQKYPYYNKYYYSPKQNA